MRSLMLVSAVVAASGLTACAGSRTLDQVRSQASFDLGCAQEQVTVEEVEYRQTYRARGCGKRASYEYLHEGSEERVILNGTVQTDAAAPN